MPARAGSRSGSSTWPRRPPGCRPCRPSSSRRTRGGAERVHLRAAGDDDDEHLDHAEPEATPRSRAWGGRRGRPLWDIPTLAGAGALRSTVPDLLRFAAANLDGDGGPLQRAMEDAHASRHTIDPQVRIGLNWHIVRPFDRDIVWHNGGTGGFVSFLGLDKARRMAVVVLSNSTASSVDDIGLHLLDERVPLTPAPEVRREIALPLAAARPVRRRLPVPARAGENHALAAGPRRPAARSRGGADLCGDRDGVLPEGHRCPDHVPARLARGGDRARAPSGRGGHPRPRRSDEEARRRSPHLLHGGTAL